MKWNTRHGKKVAVFCTNTVVSGLIKRHHVLDSSRSLCHA